MQQPDELREAFAGGAVDSTIHTAYLEVSTNNQSSDEVLKDIESGFG
jgi:hypothetical protein